MANPPPAKRSRPNSAAPLDPSSDSFLNGNQLKQARGLGGGSMGAVSSSDPGIQLFGQDLSFLNAFLPHSSIENSLSSPGPSPLGPGTQATRKSSQSSGVLGGGVAGVAKVQARGRGRGLASVSTGTIQGRGKGRGAQPQASGGRVVPAPGGVEKSIQSPLQPQSLKSTPSTPSANAASPSGYQTPTISLSIPLTPLPPQASSISIPIPLPAPKPQAPITLGRSNGFNTVTMNGRTTIDLTSSRPDSPASSSSIELLSSAPNSQHPYQRSNHLTQPNRGNNEITPLAPDDPSIKPVCIGLIQSLLLVLYPGALASLPPSSQKPTVNVRLIYSPGPSSNQGSGDAIKVILPPQPGQPQREGIVPRGDNFGVVEQKVASVLFPLMNPVGVDGKGKGRVWVEGEMVRTATNNSSMIPLHLLLFTKPHNVSFVSTYLASRQLFLQHPRSYNPAAHSGCTYRNPHNPPIGNPEADRRRLMFMNDGTMRPNGQPGAVGQSQQYGQSQVVTQREQVENIFKNLRSGVDLEQVEPDPMVATRLYPHQKQALSFLLDRERLRTERDLDDDDGEGGNGQGEEEEKLVSLWRRRFDKYNRHTGWVNVITEMEREGTDMPPQSKGAILADDMGLGKTIVVISLVCGTLKTARRWADREPTTVFELANQMSAASLNPNNDSAKLSDFSSSYTKAALANPYSATSNPFGTKKEQAKAKAGEKRLESARRRAERLKCRSRATLIVCPLSTVQNWEEQFGEHTIQPVGMLRSWLNGNGKRTKVGKDSEDDDEDEEDVDDEDEWDADGDDIRKRGLRIHVYHGAGRIQDPAVLANHDVVITTFSTVGTEYSRQCKSNAEEEDEEEDDDGFEEVDAYGRPVHQKKKAKGKGKAWSGPQWNSPLQSVEWFRVVLDEAHIIKEHSTVQARAACDLMADRRECLTGTPLQNSLNDLFSLVKFLRLEPFTDRGVWNHHIGALAKNGDPLGVSRLQLIMRHLALRRTKLTRDASGKPILTLPRKKDELRYLELDEREKAFYQTKHIRYKTNFMKLAETDSLMKNYCSILQELLRLRQICVHMDLVTDSQDAQRTGTDREDLVETIRSEGLTKMRALQLLLLMRDAGAGQCVECGFELLPAVSTGMDVDFESEVGAKKRGPKGKGKAVAVKLSLEDEGPVVKAYLTRCQHLYCLGCLRQNVCPQYPGHTTAADRCACSACQEDLSPVLDIVEVSARELEAYASGAGEMSSKHGRKSGIVDHSTKTRALMADLFPFSQANPHSVNYNPDMVNPNEDDMEVIDSEESDFKPQAGIVVKSVVFSQWTKALDKIEDALVECAIKFTRLDGTMNKPARDNAIETFKKDPSVEVMLISLRAGGVGLNLTCAQRVYLMEPFWNPAVEHQAVDRIHRLGQTRPVKMTRFIVRNSIEENMLLIQKRKLDLANMTLTQTLSKSELAKRRIEDLKTLFQ